MKKQLPFASHTVPGIGSLTPLATPTASDLHRHAVVLGPNQSASPQAIMGDFEHSLREKHSERIALVVGTSGSTGMPKRTALSARALRTAAGATENFFAAKGQASGGKGTKRLPPLAAGHCDGYKSSTPSDLPPRPAQWLLALPAHYVAGTQVLARSVLAGTTPVIASSVSEGVPFTPEVFLEAAGRLNSSRRFISLVPTQLHKLFEAADVDPVLSDELYDALSSFTGILLGGAPAGAALLERAHNAGLATVTTYGSAETAGGCVYNRHPLTGTQLVVVPDSAPNLDPADEQAKAAAGVVGRVDSTASRGSNLGEGAKKRIWCGGGQLASGYLEDSARTGRHFFLDEHGTRWYRTDDYGTLTHNNLLNVTGRGDDVIITGGIKISAARVSQCLEKHPAVRQACVFGIPDTRWGSAVAAAVTLRNTPRNSPDRTVLASNHLPALLREYCAEQLGAAAAPKLVLTLDDFPTLSTGKPDYRTVYSMLRAAYCGH